MEISKKDLVNSLNSIAVYLNEVLESDIFDTLKDIEPRDIDNLNNVKSNDEIALEESMEKLKNTFTEKYKELLKDYCFLLRQIDPQTNDLVINPQIMAALAKLSDNSNDKLDES